MRGFLDLLHPTIVVGGPRSNPVTAAFLSELTVKFASEDGAAVPSWKLETKYDAKCLLPFVTEVKERSELGIYLDQIGFFLQKTDQSSCGVVYFARRNGSPFCVIAGHDRNATEEIAKHILRSNIPTVR